MGFFGLFQNSEVENNKSHLKNLIAVAMSDGNMDGNEAKALFAVATRLGIDEINIRHLVANHNDIKFVLPKDRKDRIQQFWDLIMIILADGKIEDREMVVFEQFAMKLGVRKAIIAGLIRKLVEWTDTEEPLDAFK